MGSPWDPEVPRDPRDPRASQDPRNPRDPRDPQEPRDPQDPRDPRTPGPQVRYSRTGDQGPHTIDIAFEEQVVEYYPRGF